ncbi:uncharacterized protein B0I36DRAFT_366176 [Microdochium trichocladiopsis]|uniref:Uncharacterized protein n=1 Tax=Microdochium trichocladiopsis TaxID=1682393 RepID=A0A9P9BN64_9PEZI|nr:uncharacterized protein B0I36DRAFT_366176 [Microdochium trichocladiopsis]KAH7026636.1 hypothetical protein B0I36DRAFT_366176 [Microdochium trichocladiopsis]
MCSIDKGTYDRVKGILGTNTEPWEYAGIKSGDKRSQINKDTKYVFVQVQHRMHGRAAIRHTAKANTSRSLSHMVGFDPTGIYPVYVSQNGEPEEINNCVTNLRAHTKIPNAEVAFIPVVPLNGHGAFRDVRRHLSRGGIFSRMIKTREPGADYATEQREERRAASESGGPFTLPWGYRWALPTLMEIGAIHYAKESDDEPDFPFDELPAFPPFRPTPRFLGLVEAVREHLHQDFLTKPQIALSIARAYKGPKRRGCIHPSRSPQPTDINASCQGSLKAHRLQVRSKQQDRPSRPSWVWRSLDRETFQVRGPGLLALRPTTKLSGERVTLEARSDAELVKSLALRHDFGRPSGEHPVGLRRFARTDAREPCPDALFQNLEVTAASESEDDGLFDKQLMQSAEASLARLELLSSRCLWVEPLRQIVRKDLMAGIAEIRRAGKGQVLPDNIPSQAEIASKREAEDQYQKWLDMYIALLTEALKLRSEARRSLELPFVDESSTFALPRSTRPDNFKLVALFEVIPAEPNPMCLRKMAVRSVTSPEGKDIVTVHLFSALDGTSYNLLGDQRPVKLPRADWSNASTDFLVSVPMDDKAWVIDTSVSIQGPLILVQYPAILFLLGSEAGSSKTVRDDISLQGEFSRPQWNMVVHTHWLSLNHLKSQGRITDEEIKWMVDSNGVPIAPPTFVPRPQPEEGGVPVSTDAMGAEVKIGEHTMQHSGVALGIVAIGKAHLDLQPNHDTDGASYCVGRRAVDWSSGR